MNHPFSKFSTAFSLPLIIAVMLIPALSGCVRPATTLPALQPAAPTEENTRTPNVSQLAPETKAASPSETAASPGKTGETPSSLPASPTSANHPAEALITPIPLAGPLAEPQAEISGMAWYSDTLILLPQYPSRFAASGDDGALFALQKNDILAYLDGALPGPLTPQPVPLHAAGLAQGIKGFEGFEAIAFAGRDVYMTIESKPSAMLGYLVSGKVGPDLSLIQLNTANLTPIQPQANISNLSDETLLVFGLRLVTLYEANGNAVNPQPVAHLFDLSLGPRDSLAFPNIEYRVTDATIVDDFGRFWVMNYFFPGDTALIPADDPLADRYGQGLTHSQSDIVERLVEMQFTEDGITLVDQAPIQLELDPTGEARNWEGLARLEQRGFLAATDTFPETILAFIPFP